MEAIERYGIIFVFLIVMLASSVIGTYMLAAIDFFIGVFSRVFGLS